MKLPASTRASVSAVRGAPAKIGRATILTGPSLGQSWAPAGHSNSREGNRNKRGDACNEFSHDSSPRRHLWPERSEKIPAVSRNCGQAACHKCAVTGAQRRDRPTPPQNGSAPDVGVDQRQAVVRQSAPAAQLLEAVEGAFHLSGVDRTRGRHHEKGSRSDDVLDAISAGDLGIGSCVISRENRLQRARLLALIGAPASRNRAV